MVVGSALREPVSHKVARKATRKMILRDSILLVYRTAQEIANHRFLVLVQFLGALDVLSTQYK